MTTTTRQRQLTRRAALGRAAWLTGASAVLAACRPGAAPASQRSPGAVGPAHLVFTTWGVHPLPEGVATEKAVAAFQAATSGITVTIEPVTGPLDAILVKVQSMLAAGTPPDVTLMRPHFIAALHAARALQSIDPYLTREKTLSRDSYFKGALARLIFDNRLYGLPSDYWFTVLYYNHDIFESEGVSLPAASWTWDSFLAAARRLTAGSAPEKRYGAEWPAWQSRVRDNGGEILDAQEKTCLLDQGPAVEAIQWTADLRLRHQVVPTAEEIAAQNAQDRFLAGRLGMFPQGNWFQGVVALRASFRWDLAPLPQGRVGRRPLAGGANFCMPVGVKSPEASWLFIKFMGGPEGATIRGKEAGLFPPMPAIARPEIIPMFSAAQITRILDSGQDARPLPFVPKYAEMDRLINQELAPVWRGDATAKEATAKLVPLVNQLLQS